MEITLRELAAFVGGTVEGDPDRRVAGVRGLAAAGPEHLSLLTQASYREEARTSRAGALLVGAVHADLPHDQIVVGNPALALARILAHFHPPEAPVPGIHPTAVVGDGAVVDETARLEAYVVVGEGSRIGPRAVLRPGVVVGRRCEIGADCLLHPRVVLYDDTELGRGVVLHAGVVLGADGFGYAFDGREHVKVPQVGKVVIEDGVEVGANTAVDRATLDETRIGAGSKLDNLVQVGHNVRLGASSLVCGQAGIAGSTRLGRGVVLAGQAGVSGHIEVGDGVQVAAKSAVLQSVPPGKKLAGVPASELSAWRRQTALLTRLGELFRRVKRLERRLDEGEDR